MEPPAAFDLKKLHEEARQGACFSSEARRSAAEELARARETLERCEKRAAATKTNEVAAWAEEERRFGEWHAALLAEREVAKAQREGR